MSGSMPSQDFNPFTQFVSFLARDGRTPIRVPVTSIDAFNDESISVSVNYSLQIGACFIMLLVVLIMTPLNKLTRPSSVLHISALILCIIRTAILQAFFLSPFNHFYQFWGRDYSSISAHFYANNVAGNVFSLFLVIAIELALMHQAWTMIRLWQTLAKFTVAAVSALIALLAIGWRFAFTVVQVKSDLDLVPAEGLGWLVHATLILDVVTVCWFCALFNAKLVMHLLANRGILHSSSTLSPMEILVMTNGVLMVVPVIFAGLEWGHFANFESASLTQSSVAIILPLGTLAAQQMTRGGSLAYLSSNKSSKSSSMNTAAQNSPRKFPSVSTACGSPTGQHASLLTPCETNEKKSPQLDQFDLELIRIDSSSVHENDCAATDAKVEQADARI